MKVFGSTPMGAGGRRGVRLETGKIEFLPADLACIEAHYRVLANGVEEFTSSFPAFSKFGLVGEWLKKNVLLLSRKLNKGSTVQSFAMRIEPGQPSPEATL